MGLGEFLPSNWFIDWLAGILCDEGGFPGVCESILFILCGFDEAQMNHTMTETIMQHTPAGTSTRFEHLLFLSLLRWMLSRPDGVSKAGKELFQGKLNNMKPGLY